MNDIVLKYDDNKNRLIIRKKNSKKPIKYENGKYGIQGCFDIENNLVGLFIPEPDILFGFSKKKLVDFTKDSFI